MCSFRSPYTGRTVRLLCRDQTAGGQVKVAGGGALEAGRRVASRSDLRWSRSDVGACAEEFLRTEYRLFLVLDLEDAVDR